MAEDTIKRAKALGAEVHIQRYTPEPHELTYTPWIPRWLIRIHYPNDTYSMFHSIPAELDAVDIIHMLEHSIQEFYEDMELAVV